MLFIFSVLTGFGAFVKALVCWIWEKAMKILQQPIGV